MAPSDPNLSAPSPLSAAELSDAEALVREAGWNQLVADWQIFLDLGTVYAIRTHEGRVVATAATLPHGGRFAWISMVLVAGEFRRRGLATLLLRRCLDDLTAACLVPVLDATPAGRAVYRALGFQDTWVFHRLALRQSQPAVMAELRLDRIGIHAITDAVWPELCAYDAAAFGADRSALLTRLRGRLPGAELFAEHDGRIVGFLLGRDGRRAAQLGPLIADDDAIAWALLARGLKSVDGPIYVDLADAKAAIRARLEERGFAIERSLTRMVYRQAARFDDGVRTFAVVGPEFG